MKVAPAQHVLRLQLFDERIATESRGGRIDVHDDVLRVVPLVRIVLPHRQPGNACQACRVLLVMPAIGVHEIVDALEIREAHHGADLGHLAIGADVDDGVVALETEVLHQPDAFGERVVVGEHRAALKRIDELGGVKAQHFGIAESPDHLAAIRATERVCRVIQHAEVARPRNGLDRIDVARLSPEVHADDACGARRDQALDLRRINRARDRIHVTEHRRDLLPLQRMSGRDKRERRHDDLARHAERPNRDLERNGAVAHGDGVLHLTVLGESRLELADERPAIGEPPVVEHLRDARHQPIAVANVRAAHVEGRRKGGRGRVGYARHRGPTVS
jgi:hypothetical protein